MKQRVSQNFTYSQGSHVMRFGAVEVSEEPAAEFMGYGNAGRRFVGQGWEGGSVDWLGSGVLPCCPSWLPACQHG